MIRLNELELTDRPTLLLLAETVHSGLDELEKFGF